MDELIRAAADARRMAERGETRRSHRDSDSFEDVIRERDLMELRVRQEFDDQWRTAEFVPHQELTFSREERTRDFVWSEEAASDYAYNPFDLSARDRGHSTSTTLLKSSDVLHQSSRPGRGRDYETRVVRPSQPDSFDAGQCQPHVPVRRRTYETRDFHPSRRDSRYASGHQRPNLEPADQKDPRSDQYPQTHVPSEPQYFPPPGYNTALAQSREAIQAFLDDEYDPPPPYGSPERPRRKDRKKDIRAKDHQKALSWLAGRRRLGGE